MIRKAILLVGVFALCFAASASLSKVEATTCTYRCICSRAYKCCTTDGVETCKPSNLIRCPQVQPC